MDQKMELVRKTWKCEHFPQYLNCVFANLSNRRHLPEAAEVSVELSVTVCY